MRPVDAGAKNSLTSRLPSAVSPRKLRTMRTLTFLFAALCVLCGQSTPAADKPDPTLADCAGKGAGIVYDEWLVDAMCMQLVQKPENYDVLVMPNLYGDILSDLGAGLVGGLGVAPGANIGADCALFEATHGSAPKYKGQNKVNPTALILSGYLMLKYLKEDAAAERLENAIKKVIAEGVSVTYDMKPDRNDPTAVGTAEMADAIIAAL